MLLQYTAKFFVFYKDGQVTKESEVIHIDSSNFAKFLLVSSDYLKQIYVRFMEEKDVKEAILIDLQLTNKEDFKKKKSEEYVDEYLCAGNLLPSEPTTDEGKSSEQLSES